jgi:molecular chaperone HscA
VLTQDGDRSLWVPGALDADTALLTPPERAAIDALMQSLRTHAANSQDAATIEAATKALAEGAEPFAAARMNASIKKALAGQRVGDL